MKRRTYLATTTGLLATVAGCTSSGSNPGSQGTTDQTTQTPTTTATPTTDTTTEAPPAEFALQTVNAPETTEIGEQAQYSFTVKNTGGQAGTFSTTVQTRVGNSDWEESEPWTETIEPGVTTRLTSQEFSMDYLASVDVVITAFDEQFSMRFVGAREGWGSPYTVLDKYELEASELRFEDSYTWTSGDYEYEETPSDGNQWAWLEFSAENVSNSTVFLPLKGDIALISGNSQYSYSISSKSSGAYEGGEVQPDIVREGEILYEVPEELSKSDFSVAYTEETYDGDISVYWGDEDD